mmetsp:Transcript_7189/g.10298  ORF Transcript_7189/g.10298 Transcript_7189/m.10298 type:complete len:119 (+) Transcript_7189:373-729(+)
MMSHIFAHQVKLCIKSSDRNDMMVDIHQIEATFYFSIDKITSKISYSKYRRSTSLERNYNREVKIMFMKKKGTIIYELILKTKLRSLDEGSRCLLELSLFNGQIVLNSNEDKMVILID